MREQILASVWSNSLIVKPVWLEVVADRPALFPSPFDEVAPHALARRCAEIVMRELRATEEIAPAIPTSLLHGPTGGKMFGVLVFEASDGRVGFIRAVSGQVERAWNVEGYAPPLFDAAARDAFEPVAEVVVKQFTARVEAARADAELLSLRAELVALDALHTERRAALKARHAANKAERRDLRAQLRDFASPQPSPGAGEGQGEGALTSHELDQLSRADDAERRRNEATSREERGALLARLAPRE